MLAVFTNVLCNADETTEYDLCYGILKHYILNILIYWFIHSKNVRIIIPGHLKMTQFWSNALLLTRLVVTLGSILKENV